VWFEALDNPPSRQIELIADGEDGITGVGFLTTDDHHGIAIASSADGQNSESWVLTFPLDGTGEVHVLEDIALFGDVALLLGGKAIATFANEESGVALRTLTGELIERLPDDIDGQCLAGFNDILLAGGTGNGQVWIWAIDSKQLLADVQTSEWKQQIVAIAWHPSGDWLVTTSQGDGVRLWSVAKLQATPHGDMATAESAHVTGENRMYYAPTFSSDGALVAVGCGNGEVLLFDFASGQLRLRHTLKSSEEEVMALAFHPTLPHLVTGSQGLLSIWNTTTGELVITHAALVRPEPVDDDDDETYEEFSSTQIAGIKFARGGKLFVVARSFTVDLWDLA